MLILCLSAGCLTQRQAVRKMGRVQKKFPALFSPDTVTVDSSRTDTVAVLDTLVIDGERIDTAVVTSLFDILDSLTVENSRLKISLRTTANVETETRTWELSGELKMDTIVQVKYVPVRQVVYKTMPAAPCEVVKGAPWWYYALFAIAGGAFTYLGLKREGIGQMVKGFLKI